MNQKKVHISKTNAIKVIVTILIFLLVFQSVSSLHVLAAPNDVFEYEYTHENDKTKKTKLSYKVLDEENKTVSVFGFIESTDGNAVIPSTVPYDGKTYSVVSIANYALRYQAILSITLGSNIKTIGVGAFYACKNLTSVVLDGAVEVVSNQAFASCEKLEKVFLGKNVNTIQPNSFMNSEMIKEYAVDSENNTFAGVDGVLYSKDNKTLFAYPQKKADTTYIVSESVTVIRPSAFSGATYLENIYMSNNVEKIGYDAFSNCFKLKSVKLSESLTEIADMLFFQCFALETIVIPSSVTKIGMDAFFNCGSLREVIFTGSAPTVHRSAFTDGRGEALANVKYYVPESLVDEYNVALGGAQITVGQVNIVAKTDLTVSVVPFEDHIYSESASTTITIKNNSSVNSVGIKNISISGEAFEVEGYGLTLLKDTEIDTWSVKPVENLAVGTYTEKITVVDVFENKFETNVSITVVKALPVLLNLPASNLVGQEADALSSIDLSETEITAEYNGVEVAGKLVWDEPNTVLPSGDNQVFSATFIPDDAENYSEVKLDMNVNVRANIIETTTGETGGTNPVDPPLTSDKGLAVTGTVLALGVCAIILFRKKEKNIVE